VLSDSAQVLLGLTTDVNVLTLAALALVPVTWWVLFRTGLGLRIRASGENPAAADSLGVSPYRHRFVALAVSGALSGLAGAFLAVSALLLSRIPAGRVLRGYVSLMLAYGLALALQDTWTEQLWKRGTTDWHAPDVIRPDLSWSWLAIVVGAIAMYALWFGQTRMSAVTHPP